MNILCLYYAHRISCNTCYQDLIVERIFKMSLGFLDGLLQNGGKK